MRYRFLVVLSLLAFGLPSHADRDIVFAATYSKMSGQFYKGSYFNGEETVTALGHSHLYRINPDGTRRTRITSGANDDVDPVWSPDGRFILFRRSPDEDGDSVSETLCIVGADGGAVHSLITFSGASARWLKTYRWSPDNRFVAAFTWNKTDMLILIDVRSHRQRVVPDVEDGCWSPDGRHLYLGSENDHDRIVDVKTGKFTPVAAPLWGGYWRDDRSLIGVIPVPGESGDWKGLQVIGKDGQLLKKWPVEPSMDDWGVQPDSERGDYALHKLHSQKVVFVETHHHMTDGDHPWCSLVDLKSGKWHPLHEGRFCGLSPDTRRFAVARHDWMGPYKRGGERLGPLEIASTRTGKGRPITGRLVDIGGGDWR